MSAVPRVVFVALALALVSGCAALEPDILPPGPGETAPVVVGSPLGDALDVAAEQGAKLVENPPTSVPGAVIGIAGLLAAGFAEWNRRRAAAAVRKSAVRP